MNLGFINIKKEDLVKSIRLYVVPLVAIFAFMAIIGLLVLPKISEIFAQLDQISANNATIQDKNQQLNDLKQLADSFNDLSSQLEVVNQIAPTGKTEVVKFRDKITGIIQNNNLQVLAQNLSESDLNLNSSGDQKVIGNIILQEVPFTFEAKGKFNNIVSFIDALSAVDDFVVVKEMQFSSDNSTGDLFKDDWDFKINLIKYQFSNSNQDLLEQAYLSVSPTVQINKTISEYIKLRQQKSQ